MQFHFVAKENVMTKAKSFLVLAIAATAMLASLLEFADARAGERAGEKEESMGLRTVMKELGRNMEAVTGAISRSEEHTSELQSLMRISYAVFCLKKKIMNMKVNKEVMKKPRHA